MHAPRAEIEAGNSGNTAAAGAAGDLSFILAFLLILYLAGSAGEER